MAYRVIVADNFYYQDQDEWYTQGVYSTAQEALTVCRRIVEVSMASCGSLGMYKGFGDDPFIVADGGAPCTPFSAWAYAEELAKTAGPDGSSASDAHQAASKPKNIACRLPL